jgi:hypothetical protein
MDHSSTSNETASDLPSQGWLESFYADFDILPPSTNVTHVNSLLQQQRDLDEKGKK